ncbi:chemotaxis protein CheW [Thermocoleostomius sinensis]|uniref:Chemotaxis protein CheW n=1 Tax=Thermocoleostomius sinensis A174 TaxID=2016057 RepID=A0A9E8ZJ43_9CYAN|nr:chemotaxis protein CheW [Thermocoleostomius sinensis]WAL62669.1 chemotaxis protein CheW [Thermocoleostomius sinensis A174]
MAMVQSGWMQQQSLPNLGSGERQQVQQGIPSAIAKLLNQGLQPMEMTVKCGRKDDRLGVVVEAVTVPDQSLLSTWMRQQFSQLHLEEICKVEVYGRQIGQTRPAWRETIDINQIRVLRFQLGSTVTALFHLECVREVLSISAKEILSIPQMPRCVLGVYYHRGRILWLVDLGLQLGITQSSVLDRSRAMGQSDVPSSPSPSLNVIVIEADQQTIGFVVSTVLDIESYSWQKFQAAATFLSSSIPLPFVQSYLQDSQIPLLSAIAIIHDRHLHLYQV